jgi:hypothetical protein
MELKYTKEQIEEMRQQNADFESDHLDIKDLEQLLMDGCTGWSNMSEEDIVSYYEENVRPAQIEKEW